MKTLGYNMINLILLLTLMKEGCISNMFEYICRECDVHELSCQVEVKKKCEKCGQMMDHIEMEG